VPQVHWLVIGIGDITSKRVIPAILAEPRSTLAGLVTRHPEKAGRYPGARVWADLSDALADSQINAVYVASPVFLHAPQTIAALRAGKHVLCEKPMAMSYEQGCEMVRVARECGTTFGVAYYRRLYPKVRRAKELIAAGAIGQPVLAEINCHDWFVDADGRRSWLLDPKKSGGGPLYDIASHRIDVLNYLFGKPERVCGMLSNAVHRTEVEDSATLLIEYENKVRGIVDVRWHSHIARDECRIAGTDGEIEMSPLTGPALVSPAGTESLPAHANLHYPLIENFVSAVVAGTPLEATGATSLWTDWVTERAKAGA
jgi:predicted dehydrogenase